MDILDFAQFKKALLILEDTMGKTVPPASPAMDMPPTAPAAPGTNPTQDMGLGMELPPDPNVAPPVPEEPKPFKFVFIQDAAHKKWYGQADKDGGIKRFSVYEVMPDELESWITNHSQDEDTNLIQAALNGKRPMPSSVYSDFKREILSGSLGADKGPIDITFDSDTDYDNPATDDLGVVFLRSTK